MKTYYRDNIIKNLTIIFVLIITYLPIGNVISKSSIAQDKASLGSLLVAISILSVTACFGNFAFTYEKVEIKNNQSRILAHITTGLLMLLIGLSLVMTSFVIELLMGKFIIFNISLIILYFASVCYDFWDLQRSTTPSIN
jgi:hypothetical protein